MTEQKKYLTFGAVVLTVLSLNGCSLMLSKYERPALPQVDSYEGAAAYLGEALNEKFWEDFEDPKLNAVIEKALQQNLDLQKAALNVKRASLNVDLAGTDRHPTASARLGSSAQRALDYHDQTHKSSSTSLNLSYETDLFGKIEAANLSAAEQYRASAYDYLAMRLTVIESAATAYWQYAYARAAVAMGQQELKDSQKRYELVLGRFGAGAVDILDVDSARINHLRVEQTLNSRREQLKKARTALDTLLGQTADQDVEVSRLHAARLPEFSLDVPAQLLSRRPDLMAAEAQLRQALADYDAARLAYYPDFSLTAGLSSGDSGTLLRFLANPVAALGASITLPFVNFNQLSIKEEQAWTDEEIAQVNFVASYISAVQEVYDEVSSIELYRQTLDNVELQADLAQRNYNRYYDRYREGLSELTDFLDASDSLRSAKIESLQARRNLLQSYLSLMCAIGGDTQQAQDQVPY